MTNKEFLFASTNEGKITELTEIAKPFSIKIIDPNSLIHQCGAVPDVAEGEESYKRNALLKAQAFYGWANLSTVSDDTGIEVDALHGLPGVKTARFAGDNASMAENKALLLQKLRGVSDRSALFRCVLCVIMQSNEPIFAEAVLRGSIAESESGDAGFGYDPIFIVEGTEKTLATLKTEGFSKTHRALAFEKLVQNFLKQS